MERAVADVAEDQHGVFTLDQVVHVGGDRQTVWRRLDTGRWETTGSPGVYRIGGTPRTWEQDLMALVLAAGPGTAASHRSAAALLGIPGFGRGGTPEVTTPRSRRHRQAGVVVHRSRVLPTGHLTCIAGIPVTRVPRTLVDLAGVLHPARTQRAVENCLSAGSLRLDDLRDVTSVLATRGRPGIGVMRAILDAREPGYVALASELEAKFLDLVRRAGLPEPRRQLSTGDAASWIGRVDFAYSEARLVVELDGRRHHTGMLDREADRARDNRLVAAGWRVVRFTWSDITVHADRVVTLLGKLLGPSPAKR